MPSCFTCYFSDRLQTQCGTSLFYYSHLFGVSSLHPISLFSLQFFPPLSSIFMAEFALCGGLWWPPFYFLTLPQGTTASVNRMAARRHREQNSVFKINSQDECNAQLGICMPRRAYILCSTKQQHMAHPCEMEVYDTCKNNMWKTWKDSIQIQENSTRNTQL